MRAQMIRVISSPAISTTGFFTLIFAIADEPLMWGCAGRQAKCPRLMARPDRSCKLLVELLGLRLASNPAMFKAWAGPSSCLPGGNDGGRGATALKKTWRRIRAGYDRRRRLLRQAMLQPVLVGWPALRDVVMRALAARGHLVLCELGNVCFFVDPSDRVVGAWLMWHGGWQRREIDSAVDLLRAAGGLNSKAGFVAVGA